ncbi:MAG TPA: 23S rRNA (uracil(1939)-C(5))-methyltransferase RlmD [Terracidiphilus sp.]|nr:23S rRNA (uracil(1939)-C(5))-methyltransferase RlmD [Terracidiphilus sp.]
MKPRASRPASAPPSEPSLVQIEKPIYGGAFLARDEGKAVFVPLTLPGEQARVHIVENKSSYATAEAVEITAPASERVTPGCRHFGVCGGCQYQHASYDAQLRFKQSILRETLERGGVQPPAEIAVLAAEPWAYRNRIRLAFDAVGNPGYRTMRSHAIVPIAECPIAAPLLVRAALAAAEIIRTASPAPRLSELSLFCNAEESALLASIDFATPAKFPFEKFCGALAERIPELTGATYDVVSRNEQLPRTAARWGAASLDYQASGAAYRVDHGAFFQVNRWLVDALVDRVTSGHQGTLAWDLFAGVGLFARKLAASFVQVVAVESAPSATAALGHNLRGVRATAVKSATLDFLRRKSERPDLVVVDPPRTGLGTETTTLLAKFAAPAMVYVSCDPATLARDLRALIGSGYAIEKIALADLFPQTFHIETIVHLRR